MSVIGNAPRGPVAILVEKYRAVDDQWPGLVFEIMETQLLTKTTPNGHTTTKVYDADGELTKTTNALGQSTSDGYDENGNQISLIDANGHTTTYGYDADNEVFKLGIKLPLEQDVSREILMRKGVPAGRIRLYGQGQLGTCVRVELGEPAVAVRGQRDAGRP